jgi:hypothetical protein
VKSKAGPELDPVMAMRGFVVFLLKTITTISGLKKYGCLVCSDVGKEIP